MREGEQKNLIMNPTEILFVRNDSKSETSYASVRQSAARGESEEEEEEEANRNRDGRFN